MKMGQPGSGSWAGNLMDLLGAEPGPIASGKSVHVQSELAMVVLYHP